MRRLFRIIIIVTACLIAIPGAEAQARKRKARKQATTTATKQQPRTMDRVKREQTSTQRKISETASKLNATGKELNRQLNTLNSLNADIQEQTAHVGQLRSRVDSIGSQIRYTSDSIAVLEQQLEVLRKAYADAMRKLQPSASEVNAISFVFSAKSFREAYSRLRYLRRFAQWRERKAQDIDATISLISDRRAHLTGLRHEQDKAYRQAEQARRELTVKQNKSKEMVADLRKQDSRLRSELAEQKKRARALDCELDRLIAAEQARIAREEAARKKQQKKSSKGTVADTEMAASSTPSARDVASARAETRTAASTAAEALTGSFASNKGRLLFPVAGKYKIVRRFGVQPHPTLRHVTTDNSGIDIETAKAATVRSVFAGKVSAIFKQDGFNSIVMLRHGKYLTIYAGLGSVSVSQGQSVKAGQAIGTVYSDPSDGGRSILHFEVRNERQKLNPTAWVK